MVFICFFMHLSEKCRFLIYCSKYAYVTCLLYKVVFFFLLINLKNGHFWLMSFLPLINDMSTVYYTMFICFFYTSIRKKRRFLTYVIIIANTRCTNFTIAFVSLWINQKKRLFLTYVIIVPNERCQLSTLQMCLFTFLSINQNNGDFWLMSLL